jgi:4-hydroxybenzoate polyprenyltransferase
MNRSRKPESIAAGKSHEGSVGPWAINALNAMRLWQWSKNVLMFVPLVLAHQISDPSKVTITSIGFILFGLCASATYIWNDLRDLIHDRKHPSKKYRPIASGALTVRSAVFLSMGLLCFGIAGAYLLSNFMFLALILGYIVITTLYSFYLKQAVIFDVLILSGLYTYRMFLGASLTGISLSPWLLAFSMFFFLSLAFVKRYAELLKMTISGGEKLAGRGYMPQDIGLVQAFGVSSGLTAVLIFALYINSPVVKDMYKSPELLWLVCPVLIYWIARIWFLAGRGHLQEDPVVFAIKDFRSVAIGAVCIILVALAAMWNSGGILERFINFSL